MNVNLVNVKGKEKKKTKEGVEYTPSYLALQLPSGKFIFIKPYNNDDYDILNAIADKR